MRFASANVQTKILSFTEIVNLIIATKKRLMIKAMFIFFY